MSSKKAIIWKRKDPPLVRTEIIGHSPFYFTFFTSAFFLPSNVLRAHKLRVPFYTFWHMKFKLFSIHMTHKARISYDRLNNRIRELRRSYLFMIFWIFASNHYHCPNHSLPTEPMKRWYPPYLLNEERKACPLITQKTMTPCPLWIINDLSLNSTWIISSTANKVRGWKINLPQLCF